MGGHAAAIEILLHQGAAIGGGGEGERTLPPWAASEGETLAVRQILGLGPNRQEADDDARTPLHWAILEEPEQSIDAATQ
jgi:ankyrin repeat protein